MDMGRKKKAAPISFEALMLEQAPAEGVNLVAFVEGEIRTADSRFRGAFFKSASEQDRAREQRLRLGRLLFWLKNGLLPLGATERDRELYQCLEAKRPAQPRTFIRTSGASALAGSAAG